MNVDCKLSNTKEKKKNLHRLILVYSSSCLVSVVMVYVILEDDRNTTNSIATRPLLSGTWLQHPSPPCPLQLPPQDAHPPLFNSAISGIIYLSLTTAVSTFAISTVTGPEEGVSIVPFYTRGFLFPHAESDHFPSDRRLWCDCELIRCAWARMHLLWMVQICAALDKGGVDLVRCYSWNGG